MKRQAIKDVNWIAKLKASGLHCMLSLTVFVAIAIWVVYVLYPSIYFQMAGGIQGILLIFAVDVVLGPLLTFSIYNPRKSRREIFLDFFVIGCFQLSALAYGVHTVYQEHPALLVLYDDGNATALPHRVVNEELRWQEALSGDNTLFEGIPSVIYGKADGKIFFAAPSKSTQRLDKPDQTTRSYLEENEQALLKTYEEQSGKVWVFSLVAKYSGAYVIVDKNFKYLGSLSEKSIF